MRVRALALLVVVATVFAIFAYQHATARVGRAAPGFDLTATDGRSVTLAGLRGHVVLLDFFASWCTVCQDEAPTLATFAQRYGGQVQVVGVDWREPESAVQGWATGLDLPFPSLRDGDGTVARRYGLTGVPEAWWIDASGVARSHVDGAQSFEQLQAAYGRVTGQPIDGAGVGPVGPGQHVTGLAVTGQRLYLLLGGSGGLWSRPEAGGAWTRAPLVGGATAVAASGPDVLTQGSTGALAYSVDGGGTFSALPGAGLPAGRALLAAPPGPGPAAAWYAWVGDQLFSTADPAHVPFAPRGGPLALPAGSSASALAAAGSFLVLGTTGGIWLSSDGGARWQASPAAYAPLDANEYASPVQVALGRQPLPAVGATLTAAGAANLAGPDGVYAGAQAARGGATRLAGSPARAFAAVAVAPDGGLWAAAPNGDLYRDSGGVWTLQPQGTVAAGAGAAP